MLAGVHMPESDEHGMNLPDPGEIFVCGGLLTADGLASGAIRTAPEAVLLVRFSFWCGVSFCRCVLLRNLCV